MFQLFDNLGVAHSGALGAASPEVVDVVNGVQIAKDMQRDLVLGWLSQLYLISTDTSASAQKYSAVTCPQMQQSGGKCDLPASDAIKSTPAGALVLADMTGSASFVALAVVPSVEAAKALAGPGSNYAVIQGAVGSTSVEKKKTSAGPIIAGALVGGGIGFFTPLGPAGAAAGAGAGALVGWWLGKDDDKKAA